MELVRRLWLSEGPISHRGKSYQFDEVNITPKPVQRPIRRTWFVLQASIELAGPAWLRPHRGVVAASMRFGGLEQGAQRYGEACARHGRKPGGLMCSYFMHFANSKAEEDAARARQIRYYRECAIAALPSDPQNAPPSYRYFVEMVARLQKLQTEDLTKNSVLLGSAAQITTLKKVEAAGFGEVILYFNVGLKPHRQVRGRDGSLHVRSGAGFRETPMCDSSRQNEPGVSLRAEFGRRRVVSSLGPALVWHAYG
jgi:alkanesulfonate monooxygenase SsuD/methylene tetrahydromethanopterin reductase-like flavin-dependent oxidoreductase (luciferase family)